MSAWCATPATLLLLLAGASQLFGCYERVPAGIPQGVPDPDALIVSTTDGREIFFSHAVRQDGFLVGVVLRCEGDVGPARWMDAERFPPAVPPPGYAPLERGCIPEGERGFLPLRMVSNVQRSELDEGLTAAAIVPPTVVGGALIATAVVLGTSLGGGGLGGGGSMDIGSCPRIYSFDGEGWRLDSGTYGSAFYEAGELSDHDGLEHLVEVDHGYRLRVMNELDETEHIDAVGLSVVDHPRGTWVVPTPSGELVTFRAPRGPLRAADLRGADALAQVSARDGNVWASDLAQRDPARVEDTRDGLQLVFEKPAGAREAKLWFTGTNTRWAAELLTYLMALQGERLPQLYERLDHGAIARMLVRRLLEDVGLVRVQVRTTDGWSDRGIFEAAGNEVMKGQALRIPISDLAGDRLELRVVSGVGMWRVDHVAVEYGEDAALTVRRLEPQRAVGHDGRDHTATLSRIDRVRQSSERGDWVDLFFGAPPAPPSGRQRSFVVTTTGYDTLHITPLLGANPDDADALMLSPDATLRRSLELQLGHRTR